MAQLGWPILLWNYLRNAPACHQPVYQYVGPYDVIIQIATDLGNPYKIAPADCMQLWSSLMAAGTR